MSKFKVGDLDPVFIKRIDDLEQKLNELEKMGINTEINPITDNTLFVKVHFISMGLIQLEQKIKELEEKINVKV